MPISLNNHYQHLFIRWKHTLLSGKHHPRRPARHGHVCSHYNSTHPPARDDGIKQVWYADDATAGGLLEHLKKWWGDIIKLGPDFGYYLNATKTWLFVNKDHLEEATDKFNQSGVSIIAEGRRHLRATLGTPQFISAYVQHTK